MQNKIINLIGGILIIASFAFIVKRIYAMGINWNEMLNPATLALLITMPFLSVTIIFINSFCWKRSLALFTDRKIYNGDAFAAYTKANLAKYLPGNIGHYAARQMFGTQIGLSQLHLALASLFEIGYGTLAMLALSLLFSANTVIVMLQQQFGYSLLPGLVAIITVSLILVATLGFVFRKNKYIVEIIILATKPLFWITIFGSFVLTATSLIIIGLMFVVIVSQYVMIDFQSAFLLIGGSIASYFIGYVTPGVPGGIGVREAAMMLLLSPVFPNETILIAAIVQRVTMVIGDAIVFPISLLFKTTSSDLGAKRELVQKSFQRQDDLKSS